MQHSIRTDEELAHKVRAGDPAALSQIYDRYRSGLYRFCVRLLSDSVLADDVVQDTFVALMTKNAQLRDPSVIRSWLFTVARNECLTLLKKRRSTISISEEEEESVFEGPENLLEQKERSETAARMLNALLPQYKEVILLKEYEFMSYEEIAVVTGSTVSSVKSRLFKARRAMMNILRNEEQRKNL